MAASSQPETTKSFHPRFLKDDLVVTMPKPANWDRLSSHEKFAVKYDILKRTYGPQHFYIVGQRDAHDQTPQEEQIRINNIYATFEFDEPWVGLNNNRRRTTKRLAELSSLRPEQGGRKRKLQKSEQESSVDDTEDNVGEQRGLTQQAVAEARERERNRYIKRQKRLPTQNSDMFDVEADKTALRGSSAVMAGDKNGWSNPSRTYNLSTDTMQARVDVAHPSNPSQQGPSTQRSRDANHLMEFPAKHFVAELSTVTQKLVSAVHDGRSRPFAQSATDHLGAKSTAFAQRDIEHAGVIPKPSTGYNAPYQEVKNLQTTHTNAQQNAQPSSTTGIPLKAFLSKAVPRRWCSERMALHQKEVKEELTAQCFGILDVVSASPEWSMKHLDLRKTEAQRRLIMDFIESEKRWMVFHPQLISENISGLRPSALASRQLAHLAIDVSLERGDISRLPQAALDVHLADVQDEAMSRQLILLRSWSNVKKPNAERKTEPSTALSSVSSRSIVPPVQKPLNKVGNKDAERTASASAYPLPPRGSSLHKGFTKSAGETPAVLSDEDQATAAVVGAGKLNKEADRDLTSSQLPRSLKRKQEAEPSTSRKRPKTIHAVADDPKESQVPSLGHLRSQAERIELAGDSLATAGGNNRYSGSDIPDLDTGHEPPGTVNPANLTLNSRTSVLGILPNNNTVAPTVRISREVPREASRAADELVPEEERAVDQVRQRRANELLPAVTSAPRGGLRVDGFFYITPNTFDNFGFDDELEVAEDETRGFDLDSQGLWKW